MNVEWCCLEVTNVSTSCLYFFLVILNRTSKVQVGASEVLTGVIKCRSRHTKYRHLVSERSHLVSDDDVEDSESLHDSDVYV